MHINKVVENPKILESYNMLMIPGGFSFGDDLGSGKVLGNKMRFRLQEQLEDFIKRGNLITRVSATASR